MATAQKTRDRRTDAIVSHHESNYPWELYGAEISDIGVCGGKRRLGNKLHVDIEQSVEHLPCCG